MPAEEDVSELELAVQLIESGEHRHAVQHLATVAAESPHDPALHEAVEKLCEAVDDPVALVELGEPVYLGNVVLRAFVEERSGRFEDALCHLIRAEQFAPEAGYLAAFGAADTSDALLCSVNAERIGALLASFASATDAMDEPERSATLQRASSWCNVLMPRHEASEALAFAACMLLRRLRSYDEAIALAERFLARGPSYRVSVGLANVHRDRGDSEAAIVAYRAAARLDPSDSAVLLDIGDLYADDLRLPEALAAYCEALEREPGQPWALSSSHYYRYLLEDRAEDLEALARLSQAPDDDRARRLYDRAMAFETSLPTRPEALLKALTPDAVSSAVSSLEAPSAVAVARLLMPELEISFGDTPGLDPRVPRRSVKLQLWRYSKDGPWPWSKLSQRAEVVLNGAATGTAPIRELAASPYRAADWFARAAAIARGLGPGALHTCAATMVGFAHAPDELSFQDWVFRCQVAAAFVIAHLPDGEAALWDLVYGPVDWVSSAAIAALAQLAIEKPEHRERIAAELVDQIDATQNPIGHMCLSAPAAQNLLRIPGVPPEVRALARAVRNADG